MLEEVRSLIEELSADPMVSRGVKKVIYNVKTILSGNVELGLKCDKAIQELSQIDDFNIDAFTKTRIWRLISLLEELSSQCDDLLEDTID